MYAQQTASLLGHAGRLTAMNQRSAIDPATKFRLWSASLLLVAGAVGVVGSVIDWVTVEPPPRPPAGVDFDNRPFAAEESSEPFTGLEAGDGWVTVAAAGVLLLAGIRLVMDRRGGAIGFLAAIVMGAVAIAAYKGIDSPTSGIMERTDTVGDARPAAGLVLVAGAAFAGLVAALMGIAATPAVARMRDA